MKYNNSKQKKIMATISLPNLKAYQVKSILEAISDVTGMAVQGKESCRYVSGRNVSATAKPEERNGASGLELNFNNQTIEITSGYFSESTLKGMIQDVCEINFIDLFF